MYTRRLKERKEKNGKNVEFKVERTITTKDKKEQQEIITESVEDIIQNIESGNFKYYVGTSKTLVEVAPKYLRSMLNESKGDNIDSLPTYK